MAARRSSHAFLQRRQASAQSRQCSWCAACPSHSSAHARQATAHASTIAPIRRRSGAVWRITMRPVASQASAQSRQRRMQRTISPTLSSARSASAQLVQLAAQSRHSETQRRSTSRSTPVGCGCDSTTSRKVTSLLSSFGRQQPPRLGVHSQSSSARSLRQDGEKEPAVALSSSTSIGGTRRHGRTQLKSLHARAPA
jgi:hypothetical protein